MIYAYTSKQVASRRIWAVQFDGSDMSLIKAFLDAAGLPTLDALRLVPQIPTQLLHFQIDERQFALLPGDWLCYSVSVPQRLPFILHNDAFETLYEKEES